MLQPKLTAIDSLATLVYTPSYLNGSETEHAARLLARNCELQAQHILQFCGKPKWDKPPMPIKLYPSIEDKGLALENTQPVQLLWNDKSVVLVSSPYFGVEQLGPQNALLLRRLLGKPKTIALETGLSIFFNPNWQFKGHQHWAKRLLEGNSLPALATLLSEEQERYTSPLVFRTAAASFTQFLLEQWGQERFIADYASWVPEATTLQTLEQDWHQWLNSVNAPSNTYSPLPYLKGFNFAHQGYSIFNGYGSGFSAKALQKQAQLGANAIAIVPYSYMRNPNQPSPLPIMQRAGTETDESVIRDARYAKNLSLHTALKPQIWLGGGHWPGDVDMRSDQDWATFFEHYARWMAHYALIAEIHQFDMLCVGVEFAKATQAQPQQWIQLIKQLRNIYSGPMTYAANWGQEFEQLSFWEYLDYIGLDCYYPLSDKSSPTDAELRAAFAKKLAMAERICRKAGRPLLFTEIGYTSAPTPWLSPHEDGRGKPYDGEAQARCYAVCMEALAQTGDWVQGLLWWKYPSDLSEGGSSHVGFTPNDKPAEARLPEWFSQLPK
jgi:hypothetical protein